MRNLADPVEVMRNALADVPCIGAGFVFGSFARGDFRPDSDVDVFLLDEGIDERLIYYRTVEPLILLRREVNALQFTVEELADRIAAGSGFIHRVLRGPKIWIAGSEAVLKAVVAATEQPSG